MSARILWAIVIGFLVGVFFRSAFDISWPFAALFLLLGAVFLVYGYFEPRRTSALVLSLALFGAAGGVARMDIASQSADRTLSAHLDEEVVLVGIVTAEPDRRESNVRLTVDVHTLISEDATSTAKARVLVVAPAHAALEYGDGIRAKGRLELPEAFDTAAGRSFDYPMYLAKDGVLYVLAFAEIEKTGEYRRNLAKAFAIAVKDRLSRGLEGALPEPQAGLAAGITLGDKRSIGKELNETFITSSLIHIVVLSGYNITLVMNAVQRLSEWLPRSFRFGASGLVVAFFILMTGGAATAVRAGLMAFIAVYARMTGRVFIALRALAVVSFLMVAWNPYTLLFDPSFQLSALATLGLILFTPYFSKRLSWVSERLQLREILSSTLATQLTVLPLLLYQSGNLSLVAFPANLFALIAVPWAMGLSALSAAFGTLVGSYAVFAAFPAYVLLTYIINVAELFASLPLASVSLPAFSAWWLLGVYGALCACALYMQNSRLAAAV